MASVRFEVINVGCLEHHRQRAEIAGDALAAVPGWFADMSTSNPAAKADDPAACILWFGDEPAARIYLLAAPLTVAGRAFRCHWGMDFLSAERLRSRGAGVLLIRELLGWLHARGEFYAAYASSEDAVRVYRGLGFVHLGRAPRYLWPLKSRSILEAHLKRPFATVLRPAVDSLLAVTRIIQQTRFTNGCRFEPRSRFDDQVNALVNNDAPLNWARVDASILNWRVAMARADKRRFVDLRYLRDKSSGDMAGYVITRTVRRAVIEGHPYRDFVVMSLLDHFVTPQQEGLADAIVAHLLRQGRRQQADIVEVVTSDRALEQALGRCGFRHVGGHDVAFSVPPGFDGRVPSQIAEWRITQSTGDGFLL